MNDQIYCPKCGSNQLTTDKKGFSGGKALAGAVLTGGIGLLAGTIGSNNVIITCLACGHQFKPGEGGKPPVDKAKLEQEIVDMLKQGKNKSDAIGYAKTEGRPGLFEASKLVETIIAREGLQVAKPKGGCAVLILLVAAGLGGFAVLAVKAFV